VPELPEVETIRRDLDHALVGREIRSAVATGQRSVRRHGEAAEFVTAVLGRSVTAMGRRGKYLLMSLSDGAVLVLHLGMSGQVLLVEPGHAAIAHTHVMLGFGPDLGLRFVDPRTFGEIFVTRAPPVELAHLGVDALDDVRSAAQLGAMLRSRGTKLKPLLMDQGFVAGIGNLYADEILFAARLRYDRAADSLSAAEVRRLYRAMSSILDAAIGHRGSSLADDQYRDVFGAVGDYQSRHQAYGREGEPCPRCRKSIVRVKTGGRSTFLCPRCQA
jgi:formamidopyrimidine-DNA glycosylase